MIKLYWNIGSQPARAVKTLLDIGKIQHEAIVLDLKNNETRTPEFLKLNPLGQIPFIITQTGLGIGQSNAIMQYLCQKYPEKLLQYYGNGNLAAKTMVNVALSWYQSYYRPLLFNRIKLQIYGVVKKGIPYTQSQLKQTDKAMGEALNHLDRMLKENPYVAGQNISIADFLVYFEITNLIYYEMQSVLKDLEHVNKWYTKIAEISEVKAIQQQWRETVDGFKAILATAQPIKG